MRFLRHATDGFPLPPRGWPLALLLAFFIVAGLIGHDPWKGDDAIAIGVASEMLRHGNWLLPHLAGEAFPTPPLYHWSAALSGFIFAPLLPLHDAIRLVSGFWVGLILFLLYRAARQWHHLEAAPHEFAIGSVLALAGCLGLLVHAHEAQPMLVALAAHAAVYWALAVCERRPRQASLIFGLACSAGFLGGGLAPLLAILPLALGRIFLAKEKKRAALALAGGLALGIVLALPWPLLLAQRHPPAFDFWLAHEISQFGRPANPLGTAWNYLTMLTWFAWPALPLALWTLRARRRQLALPRYSLPLLALVSVWLALTITFEARSSSALFLLPPLALIAAPGVAALRRGAANAFDWFAIMAFSLFCLLAWLGWSAMITGWPERLALRAVKLAPGFVGELQPLALTIAVIATLFWGWMLTTGQRQRSPWRGLVHWLAGLTTFWLLITSLWMPWIEYGKSYRSVGEAVRAALPAKASCLSGLNLSDSHRALISYYTGLPVYSAAKSGAANCRWRLVMHEASAKPQLAGWEKRLEAQRPSERNERFSLYFERR